MFGSGVRSLGKADDDYVDQLSLIAQATPNYVGALLAFDHAYSESGDSFTVDAELSEFYVPNDYSYELSQRSDFFLPTCSIHPNRADAIEELERCAAKGIRLIK